MQQQQHQQQYDALAEQKKAHAKAKSRAFADPTAVHRTLESTGDGTVLQIPATFGASLAPPQQAAAIKSGSSKASQDAIRKAKVMADLRRSGGSAGAVQAALAQEAERERLDEEATKLYSGFQAVEAGIRRPAIPESTVSVRDIMSKPWQSAPGLGGPQGALTTARGLVAAANATSSAASAAALALPSSAARTVGGYGAEAAFTPPASQDPSLDQLLSKVSTLRAAELRKKHEEMMVRTYGGGGGGGAT